MTTDPNPGTAQELATDGNKVVREDVFECLSKNREYYRLVLTTNQVIMHHANNHSRIERFSMADVFGCHTLRHKKLDQGAAYICFYIYPRSKKKSLLSNIRYRERLPLVFEIKKGGNSYEQNLEIATTWKTDTLSILGAKYPKWQLHKPESKQFPLISNIAQQQSEDSMDRINSNTGDLQLQISLASYLLFLRRYLVVLNPKSGQGKTIEIFQQKVAPIMKESGIKMNVLITEHPGHARSMMASADLSEIDGIVTIGGDGILYEVVNGLRCRADSDRVSNIPIGVIAGGSGNGLARSIAEYSGEAEDYLRNPVLSTTLAAARGKLKEVNLAEIDLDGKKIYSFLSVGWGLLADIDVESEVLRALGESRFTIWSFYRLAKLRSYKAKLTFVPAGKMKQDIDNGNVSPDDDSKPLEPVVVDGDFVCVYSAYQSYIGSDLVFAPSASPNDGLIHLVYMLGDIGRARATQFLISIDKGSHLDVEGVKYVAVKEFSIEREGGITGNPTIDGELVSGDKIIVKLSPKPLKMFAL